MADTFIAYFKKSENYAINMSAMMHLVKNSALVMSRGHGFAAAFGNKKAESYYSCEFPYAT